MTLVWPDASLPEDVRRSLVGPGTPFELVEEEVLGTVMEVFAKRPRTIVEILRGGVERFGGRPYTVFPERELSFDSIIGPIAAVARGLRDKYGIEKGDRVGICAANCVEWVLTFWRSPPRRGDGRAQRLVDRPGDFLRARADRAQGAARGPAPDEPAGGGGRGVAPVRRLRG